ncbi:adenylate/guanylate cyclase domain-containing protein [Pseudanabaena sp. FACHB-2040]|uniref:adenylate/guanylate cyclase domain-containing protein n=1 Tax=Pseudanabaena sp. FACHB-2040 TaxID=2692859 RepID=UPI00168560CD|nr:adenylate/guanylate cyclase domain-containing protein [Pseudanabaena sp. FACHB-2040]MBD2257833.1 adenylate/guanylate cyclase domain-containing protein [Pseudanabaena sp. FACHB-2040]
MTRPVTSPSSTSESTAAAREIAATVDQVLLRESLSNELKLAYVRGLLLIVSTSLDILVFFFPQALIGQPSVPPTIALIGLLATSLSLTIWAWLKGRQTGLRALPVAVPIFDGLLVALFITNIARVMGESHPQILTNITAFCSLLAVSGGMRLYRRASVLTTGLALANFAYAAVLFRLEPGIALFASITILGTGFLGMWMATIVQRQVKSEAGRLVVEWFLPKTVVESAFEAPLELLRTPQSCVVTVLVTDLRDFTRYAEKLEPVAVLAFLNRWQEVQSQIVVQHGGWVDKFMGDGMLAVFGAPERLDNAAEAAFEAALAILRKVEDFCPLPIGIGLHSGEVVAGCMGSGSHLEFTVIGDTVNVAARIEGLTKSVDQPLLLSQTTQQQLSRVSQGELRSLGPLLLRGREEPLEIFTLH